jgi:hypothetical protein
VKETAKTVSESEDGRWKVESGEREESGDREESEKQMEDLILIANPTSTKNRRGRNPKEKEYET